MSSVESGPVITSPEQLTEGAVVYDDLDGEVYRVLNNRLWADADGDIRGKLEAEDLRNAGAVVLDGGAVVESALKEGRWFQVTEGVIENAVEVAIETFRNEVNRISDHHDKTAGYRAGDAEKVIDLLAAETALAGATDAD